jgi:hypothetical protein
VKREFPEGKMIVLQKIRDVANVAIMFVLLAFIAVSLFQLGAFFLQKQAGI